MGANFGVAGMDWQQRVNWERLREYRIERARAVMQKHGLGAMLCMYDENVRYITGTLTPGWNRLKPGLRYAMLCGDGRPILFEQGDIGFQIERHSPWIPEENVRRSALAQGEVVPDRIALDRGGRMLSVDAGQKSEPDQCAHGLGRGPRRVQPRLACEASISVEQAEALGAMMLKAERVCGGPVEIEWALDEHAPKLLQARPLRVESAPAPDQIWLQHPGLRGHRAGIGWGSGRSVVVRCECELERVGQGDVLVTQVAGPAGSGVDARCGSGHRARRLDLAPGFARTRARHTHGPERSRRHEQDCRRLAGRRRRRRRRRSVDELVRRIARASGDFRS